jgi:hypothetical protein
MPYRLVYYKQEPPPSNALVLVGPGLNGTTFKHRDSLVNVAQQVVKAYCARNPGHRLYKSGDDEWMAEPLEKDAEVPLVVRIEPT